MAAAASAYSSKYSVGQVVFSKSGRDKGNPFIITAVEGNFLLLADGRLRKLAAPKRKKVMHVRKTNIHLPEIRAALETGAYLTDADLRKALSVVVGKPNDPVNRPSVKKEGYNA